MINGRIGLLGFLFFISASLLAQRHTYERALPAQNRTIKVSPDFDELPVHPIPTIGPLVFDQFIAERSDQWIGIDDIWRSVDSLQYEYDIEGVLLNVKTRLPDDDLWPYDQRIDFSYNSEGLLIQATESSWVDGIWQFIENDQNITWIYNETGQTTSKVEQLWLDGVWQNDYQELYTYDTVGGNIVTYTGQYTVEGAWENDFQIRYSDYDDQENLLTEEQYDWLEGAWQPTIKILRSYTLQNWLEELTVVTFIDENWLTAYRRTYEYDNNGFLLQWLQESWQEETQNWRSFFRELNDLDEEGKLLSLTSQTWNTSDSIWRNVLTTAYEYDNQNNNTLIYSQRWNSLLQDWENYFRTFLYYGDGLTATGEEQASDLINRVFPNPSDDRLIVEYAKKMETPIEIAVWSITGKQVQPLSVQYNNKGVELFISNLPSGIYVLELIGKGRRVTHQIQVVK